MITHAAPARQIRLQFFVFVVTDFVLHPSPWTGSVVALPGKEPKTEPEFSQEIIRLSCSGVLATIGILVYG